jgi:hypothetical protein
MSDIISGSYNQLIFKGKPSKKEVFQLVLKYTLDTEVMELWLSIMANFCSDEAEKGKKIKIVLEQGF